MKTPYQTHSDCSLISPQNAAGYQRLRLPKILLACSVATLMGQFQARAVTYYWDTGSGIWGTSTGANWSNADTGGVTGSVPGSSDSVVFNQSGVNGNETVQLSTTGTTTIVGMTFANTGMTLLKGSDATTRTLSLGATLTVNSGAGAVTIGDATNVINVNLSQAATTFSLGANLTLVNTLTQNASGSNMSFVVNGAGNTLTLENYNLGKSGTTGKTVTISGAANIKINGTVADNSTTASNLVYAGSGTLTLAGNSNTYTGTTTVGNTTAGSVATLSFGSIAALGAGTSAVVLNGGTGGGGVLSYTGNSASWTRGISIANASTTAEIDTTTAGQTLTISTGNIAFGSSTETLIIGGAGNTTISSNITGGGKLVKNGTGTLLISGSNTGTSGATTINGGTLQFAKQASLYNNTAASWTAANINVASGATVAFNVGGTGEFTTGNVTTLLTNLDGAVNNNGLKAGSTIAFDTTNATGGNFTVSNVIKDTTGTGGGAVGVTKLGTGMLTLNGANTYTGATTVASGTINLGGSLAGGVDVQSNGAFTGTGTVSGAASVSGSLSGSVGFNGDVTVNNSGSMIGSHAFGANVTLNNGTVGNVSSDISLAANKTLHGNGGTTGVVTAAAGSIIAPGTVSTVGNLTVGGFTANASSYLDLRINSATQYDTLTTTIQGALNLAGDLRLTVDNSYAPTDADALLLILNAGSANAVGGQFDALNGIVVNGVSYSGDAGTLITVNGEQFTISYTAGDGNDVGLIAAAVPEPATWMVAVGGGAMLLMFQRRRRIA